VSLPDLAIHFEVDGQTFLTDLDKRVGPAADVLLRRDYAALRPQKGFEELISIGDVRGVPGAERVLDARLGLEGADSHTAVTRRPVGG
jgi:hypothetical protein